MADRRVKLPPRVLAGLVLAIVLDTAVQVSWKLAARDSSTAGLLAVLQQPLFYTALVGFGLQLWNWLAVLRQADVSFAQPFTALSYITVLLASHATLHEAISPSRLMGVALILVGVFCVSRSPVRTATATPP